VPDRRQKSCLGVAGVLASFHDCTGSA
jgi:hypothetical protein